MVNPRWGYPECEWEGQSKSVNIKSSRVASLWVHQQDQWKSNKLKKVIHFVTSECVVITEKLLHKKVDVTPLWVCQYHWKWKVVEVKCYSHIIMSVSVLLKLKGHYDCITANKGGGCIKLQSHLYECLSIAEGVHPVTQSLKVLGFGPFIWSLTTS